MICEQCKAHIDRAIVSANGYTTNLLAYGCDKWSEGRECNRDDIVRYMIDQHDKPLLKQKKDQTEIQLDPEK